MKLKKILIFHILTLVLFGISCSNDDGIAQDEIYDDGLYDLYVYDIENATNTRITDSPLHTEIDIRIYPVENKIIYQGDGAIQMVDIDGANQNTIVDSYDYGGYGISSDGKQIVYSDGNFIYLANINGTDVRQLTDDDRKLYRPKFSPVGTKILASGENGLFLVDMEGNIEQIYNRASEDSVVDATAWSFDGSKIAFDLYSGFNSKILVYDVEDKNLLELGTGFQPVWHPFKFEILFNRVLSPSSTELVSIASGSTQETIIDNKGFHSYQKWSPDGQEIIFVNGEGNLIVLNNNGSGSREINELKGSSWEPNWTYDGRYIVYYRAIWYS